MLKGALFLDLKSSLKKYCKEPFDDTRLIKQYTKNKPRPGEIPSEINRVQTILEETLSGFNEAVSDCKKGLEKLTPFENIHHLLKEGKPDPEVFVKMNTIQNEIIFLREKICGNPSLRNLWYIFQCFHTTFEMKQSFLYDQYHSVDFASLKEFLNQKDGFIHGIQLGKGKGWIIFGTTNSTSGAIPIKSPTNTKSDKNLAKVRTPTLNLPTICPNITCWCF